MKENTTSLNVYFTRKNVCENDSKVLFDNV